MFGDAPAKNGTDSSVTLAATVDVDDVAVAALAAALAALLSALALRLASALASAAIAVSVAAALASAFGVALALAFGSPDFPPPFSFPLAPFPVAIASCRNLHSAPFKQPLAVLK